jgi:hypothetical protein
MCHKMSNVHCLSNKPTDKNKIKEDYLFINVGVEICWIILQPLKTKTKLRGFSPQANYTDRVMKNMFRGKLYFKPWETNTKDKGRAIAQAVSRWLPTAAARIRALVWPSGIFGGRSGAGAGFLRVLRFPLPSQSPGAGTIGQLMAYVPSEPSLDSTDHSANLYSWLQYDWGVNLGEIFYCINYFILQAMFAKFRQEIM